MALCSSYVGYNHSSKGPNRSMDDADLLIDQCRHAIPGTDLPNEDRNPGVHPTINYQYRANNNQRP